MHPEIDGEKLRDAIVRAFARRLGAPPLWAISSSPEGNAMPLTSPRFRNNQRLQRAAENAPSLKQPEGGQAVRLLQQALIDLGYPLPKSTARYGSPDGKYGMETEAAVRTFQGNLHLPRIDGHAGHDTLYELDKQFPLPVAPLPPLPGFTPDGKISYRVPGVIEAQRQRTANVCWATTYAMMLSWRRGMSIDPDTAVRELGEPFIAYWVTDHGLPPESYFDFAQRARLKGEPLYDISPEGLLEMMQRAGVLWDGFAWQVALAGKMVYGAHIIVLYAIEGDGSGEGTIVWYMDPSDGLCHAKTFAKYAADNELYFNLAFMPWLNNMPIEPPFGDKMLGKFTQVIHY